MRGVGSSVRALHRRFNTWARATAPVRYRDAWRYALVLGLGTFTIAVTYFVVGSPLWPTVLGLVLPVMAGFTLGFAVRQGTARQRLSSLGVGLVGGGVPLTLPWVRDTLLAIGPVGILFVWLLVLMGLFGYAFPEYATVGIWNDGTAESNS